MKYEKVGVLKMNVLALNSYTYFKLSLAGNVVFPISNFWTTDARRTQLLLLLTFFDKNMKYEKMKITYKLLQPVVKIVAQVCTIAHHYNRHFQNVIFFVRTNLHFLYESKSKDLPFTESLPLSSDKTLKKLWKFEQTRNIPSQNTGPRFPRANTRSS